MVRSRRVCLLGVVSVVVGLLAACEQPQTSDVSRTDDGVLRLGSVAAVDTVTRAVAPSGRPLVIKGFQGSVALRGTTATTARLRFVRRGRGTDAAAAREALSAVTITESGTPAAYTYTLDTDGEAVATVDVTGTVPQGTALTVEQSSGPVRIAGVDGPLTVKHEHGPVGLQDAADSVTVEVRNGDVAAHFATLPPDAEGSLRTANGDVTLRVPPDASAQISAQTEAGDIRSQGLPLTEQHFSPRNAGGQYSAQLEPGEATVDLQTKNGTILIAAADSMPADTAATDTTTAPSAAPLQESPDTSAPPVPAADTTVRPTASPETTSVAPTDTADADSDNPSDTTTTNTVRR